MCKSKIHLLNKLIGRIYKMLGTAIIQNVYQMFFVLFIF